MRLYTFEARNRLRIGVEVNGQLIDLNAAHAARVGRKNAAVAESMIEFVERGAAAWKQAEAVVRFAGKNRSRVWSYDFEDVKIRAPIPRPGKIFCSGLNYRSHVEENPEAKFLEDPRFFVKVSSAVIG